MREGFTNHEVRIELAGNRHHDLLKSIHVVAVAHSFCEPRYVDVSSLCQRHSITICSGHQLSQTRTYSTVMHISVISGRVEFAIHVYMDGNVKDIGIGIKSLLATIAFWIVSCHARVWNVLT